MWIVNLPSNPLQSSPTSSLFGWNIVLGTLFSSILTLNMADEISSPYKTPGKLVKDSWLLHISSNIISIKIGANYRAATFWISIQVFGLATNTETKRHAAVR